MSFQILNTEPVYDYISESYNWTFYNIIQLKQYQLTNGNVKYCLMLGFKNPEVIYTTEQKDPTEKEFYKITGLVMLKVWKYLEKEANQANLNFNTFNKYCLELEKQGKIKKE